MNKRLFQLMALFLCCILLIVIFSSCIEEKQKLEESKESLLPEVNLDQPSILPDWEDGEYHDYYGTIDVLNEFEIKYPDLVNVFSIGESVLGRDIWCIRITNENNYDIKYSCLIDGCIHGREWEAGEACLYLSEYLLINFDANKSVTHILNSSKVYIIPLVNPDGRQNNERWNDKGVNLDRNFDVFFGKLRGKGGSFRLGKLFGRIKIPYIEFPHLDLWFYNCGRHAFSEPETQAIRDFMKELDDYNDFSFYVNCHTAWHNIITTIPWAKTILKPPFVITQRERNVYDDVKDWIEANTEYEADRSKENKVGGWVMDWCFKEFRIPSFAFELLSEDYELPIIGGKKHDHLVHWMKTTLPVFIYLLVNIENLHNWETPDVQPPLPEGVPPEPLQ